MGLKTFKIFESHINPRKEVRKLLSTYNLLNKKAIINDDLTIDYDGDVLLSDGGLKIIPIKFTMVTGYFNCASNKLEDLRNCPTYVYGNFNCSFNNIKTLADAPLLIGGVIHCSDNLITNISVDHYNKIYRGHVDGLQRNPIKNLLSYLMRRTNQTELSLVERLEEFEVIKNDNEIDMICMNQLFDFYNISFLNVDRHLMETKGVMENYILK